MGGGNLKSCSSEALQGGKRWPGLVGRAQGPDVKPTFKKEDG